MALPDLNNPTKVEAKNSEVSLTDTSATQLISNAASSGKSILVEAIYVANIETASPVSVTLRHHQGATDSGTGFELAPGVSVPPNATLILVSRDASVFLMEGESLYVTAGASNKLKVSCYYKEVS